MKDSYFKAMRKEAAAYQRKLEKAGLNSKDWPLYSKGQSYAYKFWSCAHNYEQDEITVDELPSGKDLKAFVDTLRLAGVESIVLTEPATRDMTRLTDLGCTAGAECRVNSLLEPRNITKNPTFICIKGMRVYL